jgi:CHAT domain-containing protein
LDNEADGSTAVILGAKKLSLLMAAASAAALTAAVPAGWTRAGPSEFGLGANGEGQACRAQQRLDSTGGDRVDLYCGEWERASGEIVAWQGAAAEKALSEFAQTCPGAGTALQSPDFTELRQVPCSAGGEGPIRRYGIVARRGDKLVLGTAFPADWAPMVAAARVLSGAARPQAVAQDNSLTPGLREIQSVYPAGAPGISASINQEILRRRAYEQNTSWSFAASERDFSELLRAQERLAPDDAAGSAEILAEIGLNLSGERRFQEAADSFDAAELRARAADAGLLLTKITNYRAIDKLNQRQPADALVLARQANAERDRMFGAPTSRGPGIGAAEARRIEAMAAPGRRRAVAPVLSGMTDQDRAAILSAQADYLAASALTELNQPGADKALNSARDRLASSAVQPSWLVALIYEERSRFETARGNPGGGKAEAQAGLQIIRRDSPGTRAEGHLLMALAEARRAAGDQEGALNDGRTAVALFARHREAPGMPADVAAPHLNALYAKWQATHAAADSNEYFATLALVWDGAAARSAAQLAARLAAGEGGQAVRDYQDAERAYRAALARRQRLSVSPETPQDKITAADTEATAASVKLADAESAVRAASPRYLELLSPAVTAAELQGALLPGEGYVRLVTSNQGGFGALVTRDGVTPYRFDLTTAQAEAAASRLRKSAMLGRSGALPDFDLEDAQVLYAKLFGSAGADLANLANLQIDAGGPLASIPYPALVTAAPSAAVLERIRSDQDYEGVAWLARNHNLAVSLGPAAFVRTRAAGVQAAETPAYAFGNFTPDPAGMARRLATERGLSDRCRAELEAALKRLQPLPETAGEAEASAAVFGPAAQVRLAAAFTDQAVLKDPAVARAGVLVLATHGVLSLSSCLAEPALIASLGPEGDGLIEASDVVDAGVHARLVVMSACDTAGGGGADAARSGFADGGEALSGLARAFIYAGANSVLATHWKVDSTSSSLQTQALLTSAVRSNTPLSAALGAAQKALYDSPETAHPFYWSGFVLIGDGSVRLGASQTTASR